MIKKVLLFVLLAVFLGGCRTGQSSKIVTGGIVSTNLNENTIVIKNYSFDPTELTVTGGSTITVTNSDTVPHTLTADDKSFDTGKIDPGQSVQLQIPPKDGSFGFFCTFHPYMRGKFSVTNSPTSTPTPTE